LQSIVGFSVGIEIAAKIKRIGSGENFKIGRFCFGALEALVDVTGVYHYVFVLSGKHIAGWHKE
jgi:putative Mn2+ efflux pump MntP